MIDLKKTHLLSLDETASLLRVNVSTLYRWRYARSAPDGVILEPIPLGRRLYYTHELLADYQQRRDARRRRLRRDLDPRPRGQAR